MQGNTLRENNLKVTHEKETNLKMTQTKKETWKQCTLRKQLKSNTLRKLPEE